MHPSDSPTDANTPWYKQFWPWFLILVPLSSMIFSLNYAKLAVTTDNDLVVDEYYKEGRVINTRLDKIELAQTLNISTFLNINGDSIALTFNSGAPKQGQALRLNFYHVTIAARDFELLLTRDAAGVYRGSHSTDIIGKWKVSLTPLDEQWKIQKTMNLPYSDTISFEPE
ncbi:FixH family protein [Glaciecola sp.]|nr:FixH family protein [Glaciecola sp.]